MKISCIHSAQALAIASLSATWALAFSVLATGAGSYVVKHIGMQTTVLAASSSGDLTHSSLNEAKESARKANDPAVAAATENFYTALNIMFTGNGQPMKNAWSHADDITYMGPDGNYLIGWNKIEQEWNTQAANKLGGHITPVQIHTVVGSDLAFITCIESGENLVNGKKERVQLRSSTVFRKENGAWKVIGHQTDLLGYMNRPK